MQAALVETPVGHHGVEEHGVALHRRDIQASVTILMVAVPWVVLVAVGVERARKERLATCCHRLEIPEEAGLRAMVRATAVTAATARTRPGLRRARGRIPKDGGEAIASAVLDAAEHLRLAVVVVRIEEVAVGAILLALGVAHDLESGFAR